ncbi:uncharacterized protein LY89DRAFT_784909 [Mollisia scopiformis]|uniref:MYND-type domain-containing protein n=1 Tax=Mollisia scopiformis TaxID=149040 RepID=A0A194WYW8_MOLSC|nr:uncharacterized protein LY89DRAFT_784909 [Mollisia scopiformis]KUJ13145.1 hypothetical protein LY89DRAFT_784909 [Mollisia scopiformis]
MEDTETSARVCSGCQKDSQSLSTPLRRCSKCMVVVSYCSRECQKKDWKEHKTVCIKASDTEPSQASNQTHQISASPSAASTNANTSSSNTPPSTEYPPNLEPLAFPTLFPYGRGHWGGVMPLDDYIRLRLREPRFVRHGIWMAWMMSRTENLDVKAAITAASGGCVVENIEGVVVRSEY